MTALDYLFSLEKLGIKFGLENIRTICGALGDPQLAFRSVIVAGTNGKGSVTAMAETALRAAGFRTACYTSPHLVRLEERFAIGGSAVATSSLCDAAERVRRVVAELRGRNRLEVEPTFFEVATAVAFELFREARVDIAVLEVGMGGRLDATNVALPLAAAITTIDLDHERFLGNTIREVAFEKAGVIKAGMPVVVGETKPEALEVITRVCRERGARFVPARGDINVVSRLADGRLVLALETASGRYGPLALALRGRHQVDNAMVAVRLLEELNGAGIHVPRDAVCRGLTDAVWRGRLDLVDRGAGRLILFDAAHNPAGAAVLASYLGEVYPDGLPFVFGAMRDKDVRGMLAALAPCATRFVFTEPRNPRVASADSLAELARGLGVSAIEIEPVPEAALGRAERYGSPVCVAGSIFLVGDLLGQIGVLPEVSPRPPSVAGAHSA